MEFKIKEAREMAGLTQRELAMKIGLSPSTLNGYEKGNHDPRSDTLSLIAEICGVTVGFLLGIEEKKPYAANSEELLDEEIIERLTSLTPEELARVDAFVQGLLAGR